MKALGFNDPESIIGTGIRNQDNRTLTILGVVSDFHQEGLQEEIKPMAFVYGYNYEYGYCAAKLDQPTPATLKSIQKVWDTVYPNDPFDYFFLDQRFNEQYRNEVLFFRLCLIFGIIATLIAGYGMFGISVETVSKRRKEIGIRKVNGATVLEIMGMLNRLYIKLTLISFLIAFPFAYFSIRQWLESFAYRTPLTWWIFILAGVLTLGITLFTVSWQSWRAAVRNPVEALRYE
jgi:putative ABC transport system permease protein